MHGPGLRNCRDAKPVCSAKAACELALPSVARSRPSAYGCMFLPSTSAMDISTVDVFLLYVSRPSARHKHRLPDTPWKICMHAQRARAAFPYVWYPHQRCCASVATKSLFVTSVWTVLKPQRDKISRKKNLMTPGTLSHL